MREDHQSIFQRKKGSQSKTIKIKQKNKYLILSRVIGTLLGSIDGGVVTIRNCYKVPHKEEVDEVAINMEFNENLYRLQKKVASNEVIVGWFTTSKSKNNESMFFGQLE